MVGDNPNNGKSEKTRDTEPEVLQSFQQQVTYSMMEHKLRDREESYTSQCPEVFHQRKKIHTAMQTENKGIKRDSRKYNADVVGWL